MGLGAGGRQTKIVVIEEVIRYYLSNVRKVDLELHGSGLCWLHSHMGFFKIRACTAPSTHILLGDLLNNVSLARLIVGMQSTIYITYQI